AGDRGPGGGRMTELLRKSRRRTRRTALACGGAILVGFVWALLPVSTPRIDAPSFEVSGQGPRETKLPPLDARAFDTPVWTIAAAPQPPPPPIPPPPPPPPIKLQLIGILKEDQDYKAVLYDPDTNKLFVVSNGGVALGHTIDRVAADTVTIKDGTLVRTLALKTGG